MSLRFYFFKICFHKKITFNSIIKAIYLISKIDWLNVFVILNINQFKIMNEVERICQG